jgi:uncharacterized membrane protein YidH (DUF202 family)
MNREVIIALLAAVSVIAAILALWRFYEIRRRMRERLGKRPGAASAHQGIFRDSQDATSRWKKRIAILIEQAGYDNVRASRILLLIVTCMMVAGLAAWRHT